MEESCFATFGNMSRIGNNVITIPEGVKIENNTQHLSVTGPKGQLSVDICEEVTIKIEDNGISVSRNAEDKVSRSMHGTTRQLISNEDFIEIYCKASIETCETRDVKGLYKRARAGEITNYTGIDSPYEVPENPELTIDTDNQSLEGSVSTILSFLKSNGIIN